MLELASAKSHMPACVLSDPLRVCRRLHPVSCQSDDRRRLGNPARHLREWRAARPAPITVLCTRDRIDLQGAGIVGGLLIPIFGAVPDGAQLHSTALVARTFRKTDFLFLFWPATVQA